MTETSEDPTGIINSEALTRIFGRWPSFHDAEVQALRLRLENRYTPCVEADIHLFQMTSEVTAEGHYRLINHTLATIWFEGVRELNIDAFDHQNVLFDLLLKDVRSDQHEGIEWEVAFESSVGMEARFRCGTIAVLDAKPFDPPAHVAHPGGTRSGPRPL